MSKAVVAVLGPNGSVQIELEDESKPVERLVDQVKELANWVAESIREN